MTEQRPMSEAGNVVRTVRVSKGLFVLRYVSSKAGRDAPMLSVSAASSADVELIWPGAETGGFLGSPGDAMVVRSNRDSLISIAVMPLRRNGSCDAELVLERVSTTLRDSHLSAARGDTRAPPDGIEILAHVARRGDVVVPAGTWICGPDVPMAIEGVEIRWPRRPHGIDIIGRAATSMPGVAPSGERPIGTFLGTRGRAAPLTSLALSLVGDGAQDLTLTCDALFLGLPVMTVRGHSCVLRGPSGTEPLVGLRLSVDVSETSKTARPTRGHPLQQSSPAADSRSSVSHAGEPSRVRIFRSSKVKSPGAYSLSK